MNYTFITIEFPELDKFDKNIFAVIDLVGDKDYSSTEIVPATLGGRMIGQACVTLGRLFSSQPSQLQCFLSFAIDR